VLITSPAIGCQVLRIAGVAMPNSGRAEASAISGCRVCCFLRCCQFLEEGVGALFLLGGLPPFSREVTLAGDGGILERVGPRAQLPGDGFGQGFEF